METPNQDLGLSRGGVGLPVACLGVMTHEGWSTPFHTDQACVSKVGWFGGGGWDGLVADSLRLDGKGRSHHG